MNIKHLTFVFALCIIALGILVTKSNQVYECTRAQQIAIMDYATQCKDEEFNECFNKATKNLCKKRT